MTSSDPRERIAVRLEEAARLLDDGWDADHERGRDVDDLRVLAFVVRALGRSGDAEVLAVLADDAATFPSEGTCAYLRRLRSGRPNDCAAVIRRIIELEISAAVERVYQA